MKISTLTFHRAINYGAALQTYALFKYLRSSRPYDEIGVLDYVNSTFIDRYKTRIDLKNIKRTIISMLTYRFRNEKIRKFTDFIEKNVNIFPFGEFNLIDKCFVGSDQVWNAEIVGYDKTYLLDFLEVDKKCSYAASIGEPEVSDAERVWLEGVKTFKHISVREPSSVKVIESIANIKPSVVPDPVFLLNRVEWNAIETTVKGVKEPFILIYKFGRDSHIIDIAKKYAEKYGYSVVIMNDTYKTYRRLINLRTTSPDEFLWLIDHCECVFTNSFHATAFSIIYNKNFYVDLNTPRNTRIVELLAYFDLDVRAIREYEGVLNEGLINWNSINKKIACYRDNGVNFIEQVLS